VLRSVHSAIPAFGIAVLLVVAPRVAKAGEAVVPKELYAARCAFCHGDEGEGDGMAAEGLDPRPTDFTRREFGEKSTEQVREAIRNGKPGSAMVGFGEALSGEEIDALAAYVRHFAAP
jgi:mono/diheme cytochrome c family protein